MWFFNIGLLPFFIIGMFWVLFAKPIINFGLKNKQDSFFNRPIIRQIFLVWPVRFLGIAAICVFLYMGINRPWRGMMKKVENRLVLLEQGKVAEGRIVESWYDNWAPPAWMVLYNFKILNPLDGEEKTYWGSARGPKKYYANLSKGDTISIIYNPSNPKINCEMYYFLNHPSYRKTFKKAGKLKLLDRFRDEYKFEDYSEMSWYDSARQK
jgi:hypothetical protein